MPLAKCGGCGRFISSTDGAKCGNCSLQFHRACVGIPTKGSVTPNWRCPECKKRIPRDNKTETPVRAACSQVGVSMDADMEVADQGDTSATNSSLANDSQELLSGTSPAADVVRVTTPVRGIAAEDTRRSPGAVVDDTRQPTRHTSTDLQIVLRELKVVREEIQLFRNQLQAELAELKVGMGSCIARLDSLEGRVEALEQRASPSSLVSSNVDGIVEELRRELNDRDQDLLANDIEISNMPETTAENPVHIVKLISQKLGVTLEERDIVSAERVGGRHINATSPGETVEQRPRAIVVRLARRDLRDELLHSARVRRGATTADLGMTGQARRFFLNERLTKTNRQLFRKTRSAAGLHGWKYAWTKRGRILVRNKPGDPTRRIRSETDIATIIGPTNETS